MDEFEKYDVHVKDKRNSAIAMWKPEIGLAELTQMKGNFWKLIGFSEGRKNFLYPEEALFLLEKALLLVTKQNHTRYSLSEFYDEVLRFIPLPIYLTFLKLKSLNYIPVRRRRNHVQTYRSSLDLIKLNKHNKNESLLDTATSYHIYIHTPNWTKKALQQPPAYHLIIMNGENTLNSSLTIKLLTLSRPVPLLFSCVSPSGSVLLQEFSDALIALDWGDSGLAIPSTFQEGEVVDVSAQIQEYRKQKSKLNSRKPAPPQGTSPPTSSPSLTSPIYPVLPSPPEDSLTLVPLLVLPPSHVSSDVTPSSLASTTMATSKVSSLSNNLPSDEETEQKSKSLGEQEEGREGKEGGEGGEGLVLTPIDSLTTTTCFNPFNLEFGTNVDTRGGEGEGDEEEERSESRSSDDTRDEGCEVEGEGQYQEKTSESMIFPMSNRKRRRKNSLMESEKNSESQDFIEFPTSRSTSIDLVIDSDADTVVDEELRTELPISEAETFHTLYLPEYTQIE